jgi:PAS domain S-box-containing protein
MPNPDLTHLVTDSASTDLGLERMRALLAYSWDILSLLDGEGRLIYNSPAAQRIHGFEPSEMEGRSTFEFFHPDDAPRVAETFQACLAQPGKPFSVQYRYAQKGGSWIWMEAVAVNLLDTPSIQAIVVNSRDITERTVGEQALRDSEQFSDLILNALSANVAVLDEQGRIIKVNQAWRDFSDANTPCLQPFSWEGANYLEVCEHATGLNSEGSKAMADGIRAMLRDELPEFTLEYPCPSPTKERWFQARITRFHGSRFPRLVVAHLDVTALKEAEGKRLELERLLHRAQKMESLGSLAGGVAHDMNNVLGSILGIASMHQELQPRDSITHQAFSIITKACSRGGALVRRLLDFARQDLSEVAEVHLNLLIVEEVQLLERTTLSQVQFTTDLAPNLLAIHGDSSALVHAVMNLCLNAVDAMANGGRLTIRTRNGAPGWVELEVEDTGSGMPREVMEKALDPFFTTKPMGKGTGLGLSIVYSTVNAHQGTMELQSEPGKGTKVILRFPAVEPSQASPGMHPESTRESLVQHLDILLIDDDELIQFTLGPVIECLGHRPTLATSGEQALEHLDAGYVPQVVILDMNMPGLGGHGTLPLLRERLPEVPILLSTGRVDQDAVELAQAYAHVKLLPKPFTMKELKARLDALSS